MGRNGVDAKMAVALTGRTGQRLEDYKKLLLELNNQVVAQAPEDLVINTHVCRGNYHSTFFSSGAYDSVADLLFGEENVNAYYLEYDDLYEIVDGYHRYLVMKQSQRIYDREKGMLPVTVIEKDISNRMASTIRHNRARGMHNLELMTEIVTELVKSGMSDKWIMRNIGMDKNELLRFKQISGLAELFRDKEFGWSDDWSEED